MMNIWNVSARNVIASLALATSLLGAGCAGSQQYQTGVQVAQSSQLFGALRRVAESRKLEVSDAAGGVSIKTEQGDYLQYLPYGKEVALVVSADETRQASAKELGESLIVEARQVAKLK